MYETIVITSKAIVLPTLFWFCTITGHMLMPTHMYREALYCRPQTGAENAPKQSRQINKWMLLASPGCHKGESQRSPETEEPITTAPTISKAAPGTIWVIMRPDFVTCLPASNSTTAVYFPWRCAFSPLCFLWQSLSSLPYATVVPSSFYSISVLIRCMHFNVLLICTDILYGHDASLPSHPHI